MSLRYGRRSRGQALILAIIIMILLAVLATAMIAVVSRGLDEGERDEAKVRAKLLAEAGLRYADEMLSSTAQGADWRPALPDYLTPGDPNFDQASYDLVWDSYELLRGWDPQHVLNQMPTNPVYFVKYRWASDPEAIGTSIETVPQDDPTQDFVDPAMPIRPVENVEETAPHDHFLLRVEWAPGAALPGGAIDPLSKFLKITAVGRPGGGPTAFYESVAYKPVGIQDYLLFIHDRSRSGNTADLGLPFIDVDGDGSTISSNRNAWLGSGDWDATGNNDAIPLWLRGPVRANLNLRLQAPVRIDPVESTTGWQEKLEVSGSLEQTIDAASTASGNAEVLIENPDGSMAVYGDANEPAVSTNQTLAPSGQGWPSQLDVGVDRRIEAPQLESYEPVTGISRWERLTKYSGDDLSITINSVGTRLNSGELGYGRGIYVDNETQLDQLATAPNSWARPDRWGGRRFIPNGCIIELFAHYPDPLNTADSPAIVITRTDGSTWTNPSGAGAGGSTGQRSMVFAFPDKNGTWGPGNVLPPQPDNGIILCEGNVRILGRLPASNPGTGQDYGLTVVSRGSIYVDGPLLRPSDYSNVGVNAPENTRIALLARDHIVLNPTTLAPGLVPGMPPAPFTVPPEAPQDGHWALDPNGTTAVGLRVSIADPNFAGNRHVYVEQSDGNVNDALQARSAVIVHKVRATLGLTPAVAGPATTTTPYMISADVNGLPAVPGRAGVGTPTYFADWANLARAQYSGSTAEYLPDTWGIPFTNFNTDPAAQAPGVPSYITIQGGVDLTDASTVALKESRSDVIVKNAKIDRWGNSDPLEVRPGLDFVVAALMYAERGGFYIVPGDWFDSRVSTLADVVDVGSGSTADTDADEAAARYARLRRYNYRIQIRGAIAINQMPSIMEAGEWTDHWAYPPDEIRDSGSPSGLLGAQLFNEYDAVQYQYDWGLRTVGMRPNVPRLPSLPASPGLVYAGEENKQ